jgi:glutamyl-tRNA reductase
VPLSGLADAVADADLVVSCTGAVGNVISVDLLAKAQQARSGNPLVLLDLALPRDVEPGAADIPGVTVVDLESLAEVLERTQHASDVEATRVIVAEEVAAFLGWQRAASVAPTVVALRGMADAVVRAELARLAARLPGLEARTQAEIEHTVQRVVDKVLHAPTVRVKELAGEPGGQAYADALSKLFDLDQSAVEAVTRAVVVEER